MTRGKRVGVLLGSWLAANFLTHILVFLSTGKIYYQLSPTNSLLMESSIAFLNLIIPILALKYILKEKGLVSYLGWRWKNSQVLLGGTIAFLASWGLMALVGQALSWKIISYDTGQQYSRGNLIFMAIYLLVLIPAGEETMHRGFLQRGFTDAYGGTLGVLIPALLFGLRHLPSDIYFGWLHHSPPAAYINRFFQLYVGAIIWGLARHYTRSTWASWIPHVLYIIIITFVMGGLFKAIFGL